MKAAAVLFSGGVGHPFEQTSPLLAAIIAETGWTVQIDTDLDRVIARLDNVGLLAVNALYWSMIQHEKYAPLREQWARSLSNEYMQRMEAFVEGGGALFVLHTGTICWDTQPRWRELMGGGWDWERSNHPPLGKFTVQLTDAGARITHGGERFEVVDEAYHELAPADDCTILATADLGEGEQPLAWLRHAGRGRVAVDALGHDARSLNQPIHRNLIRAQLEWLRK